MNISRNKIEEKTINLRRMEIWRFRETGIEKMLLYFIINKNNIKQGATNMQQIQTIFENVYLLRPFLLDSYKASSADLI